MLLSLFIIGVIVGVIMGVLYLFCVCCVLMGRNGWWWRLLVVSEGVLFEVRWCCDILVSCGIDEDREEEDEFIIIIIGTFLLIIMAFFCILFVVYTKLELGIGGNWVSL